MKPFDLEQAKVGKPVCTRDGRKATILCFDHNDRYGDYPIVAKVSEEEGYDAILKFRPDGRIGGSLARDGESVCDLMMDVAPTYRPFESAEEVLEAIKEHGSYVKEGNTYRLLKKLSIHENGEICYSFSGWKSSSVKTWEYVHPFITFADGTPFGKLEE